MWVLIVLAVGYREPSITAIDGFYKEQDCQFAGNSIKGMNPKATGTKMFPAIAIDTFCIYKPRQEAK